MRHLALVLFALVTLLAAPFSGLTWNNVPGSPWAVRAEEAPLNLMQAQVNGTTTRVSIASNGAQGNGSSSSPALSADGRYVAFGSNANNLVSNDISGIADIFVHDRQTRQTSLVSVASDGTQDDGESFSPSISADGRYVAFASTSGFGIFTSAELDVFIHDRQTAQTSLVSLSTSGGTGAGDSDSPSISADGRYVAFRSLSGLVNNDTNGVRDIFIRDRQTSQTSRVSVASNGAQGNDASSRPSLSADGRYVAFESAANNLVSNDTNGWNDIFVRDRQTSQTRRVSVASNGTQGNIFSFAPSLSADGRYVAFESAANNLVSNDTNSTLDIFVHDRQTSQTSRVSIASNGTQANDESFNPSLSADGRYVAFESFANNLVSNDTNGTLDIFVHDRQTGQTSRVSVASNGAQGNGASLRPSLSANGRYIAFSSQASTLVSGDTNGAQDVFVHALPVHLYLPLILKPAPQTYLFITSINTGGINPVEIRDPDNGNGLLLSCVIGDNVTQFCGSFPPVGTYTIIAHTRNCGLVQGTFNDATPEAGITRRVICH